MGRSPTKKRHRQDSNLRGGTPTDFESVALTTRPRCLNFAPIAALLQNHDFNLKYYCKIEEE